MTPEDYEALGRQWKETFDVAKKAQERYEEAIKRLAELEEEVKALQRDMEYLQDSAARAAGHGY